MDKGNESETPIFVDMNDAQGLKSVTVIATGYTKLRISG
jgi:hypothetical protein